MSTAAPATTEARPHRLRRTLAVVTWAAAAVESAFILFAQLIFPELAVDASIAQAIEFNLFVGSIALVVMVFATSGLLIIRGQADNSVGWLMLAGAPALGAVFVGYTLGAGLETNDPETARWFVLAGVTLFGPALFLLAPGLTSVFPDGRPLGGWWTLGLLLTAAAVAIGAGMLLLTPGAMEPSIQLTNPAGIPAISTRTRDVANGLIGTALGAGSLVAIASLVVRYLGSSSETRHQLKWFISAGCLVAVLLPLSLVVNDEWTAILAILALALIPVAVLVAVLRYRLYEIDTLINRTLVYIPLVGIVAGLYAGLVALLQRLFTAVTGNTSDAAAVISALVLAAVFTPLRNSIQSAVDRRFKPDGATATKWEDPEFRAAVEAIVRDVTKAGT
jgi:two-component system NarL family sensor kinase